MCPVVFQLHHFDSYFEALGFEVLMSDEHHLLYQSYSASLLLYA